MSTVDDLMALAGAWAREAWLNGGRVYDCDLSSGAERDAEVALRAAIESALRAEYERGRSECKQGEPVAWRPAFKFTNPAMESGRTWNGGKPSETDIAYWTKHVRDELRAEDADALRPKG